jgi:hypothetical protein
MDRDALSAIERVIRVEEGALYPPYLGWSVEADRYGEWGS